MEKKAGDPVKPAPAIVCAACEEQIRSKYLVFNDDSRVCAACALASGLAVADIRPATDASGRHVARVRGRFVPARLRAMALRDLVRELEGA